MDTLTPYKKLKKGMVNMIVPPNYQAAITGAWKATQDKSGTITVTYLDGTTESRTCDREIESFEAFNHIVSYVQFTRI